MRRVEVLQRHLLPEPAVAATSSSDATDWRAAVKAYARSVGRLRSHGELPSMTVYELTLLLPGDGVYGVSGVDRAFAAAEADGSLLPLEMLPGPWRDAKTREEQLRLILIDRLATKEGWHSQLYAQYQVTIHSRSTHYSLTIHTRSVTAIVASAATSSRLRAQCTALRCSTQPRITSLKGRLPHNSLTSHSLILRRFPDKLKVTCRVILGDPGDAARVSRIHTQKEPNFGLFMDRYNSCIDY